MRVGRIGVAVAAVAVLASACGGVVENDGPGAGGSTGATGASNSTAATGASAASRASAATGSTDRCAACCDASGMVAGGD